MWNRVLILTMPNDLHAFAVKEAIDRMGGEAHLYVTTNFPILQTETIRVDRSGKFSVHIEGIEPELAAGEGWTVWNRRPGFKIDREVLDPADRGFASQQCRLFRQGLQRFILPEAFWVNPLASLAADLKACQQRVAVRSGLAVPETLYTNDPILIREFLRKHGDCVVYKPLRGTAWRDENNHHRVTYSTKISSADLVKDELLRTVPGIYQNYIEKDFELRVTFVGERALAARVKSQQSELGKVDWREAYEDLELEPFTLPTHVYSSCRQVMRDLGLVFGCFDLIVTPEGEYVFLEVNPMGQWLFVEMMTGVPVLDTFSHFLLSGTESFTWAETPTTIRYSDVQDAVDSHIRNALEQGVLPANWFVEERLGIPSEG